MCGRIAQSDSPYYYAMLAHCGFTPPIDLPIERLGNFNAAPGAKHWTFREPKDGHLVAEPIRWHYPSRWAAKKGMPPAISARLDKLLTPYYRGLMTSGRIIVPADGWYEWTGDKANRQPWYIKARSGAPLYLAALTDYDPDTPDEDASGFVIVTDAASGGMVDVQDRRPVVLTPENARSWMDPDLPFEQAEHLARSTSLPTEGFEWYEIGKEVNNARNNGPHLVEPRIGPISHS
jgi:putative SOS response-associated peptidase YedK